MPELGQEGVHSPSQGQNSLPGAGRLGGEFDSQLVESGRLSDLGNSRNLAKAVTFGELWNGSADRRILECGLRERYKGGFEK